MKSSPKLEGAFTQSSAYLVRELCPNIQGVTQFSAARLDNNARMEIANNHPLLLNYACTDVPGSKILMSS
jgi:hypothetical protein